MGLSLRCPAGWATVAVRDDAAETAARHGCRNGRRKVPGAVPAGTARGALLIVVFHLGTASQSLNHDFTFCEHATAVIDFAGFLHNL